MKAWPTLARRLQLTVYSMPAQRRQDPADPLERLRLLGSAAVVPDSERCVQCGICSYNCPLGIDVRGHARRGACVLDRQCLTCGECIRRCPRDVLRFDSLPRSAT